MSAESVVLVPYSSDPLETLAALMLDRHRRELPDLSQHVILFPHPGAIPRFRGVLLSAAARAGHGGVLAPWCGTLDSWLQSQANDAGKLIDDLERDLQLLSALRSFTHLHERYGTWPLVDSLLALFDELNAHYPALPSNVDRFAADLAEGYGLPEPIAALNHEANLVHTLWNAWNLHLEEHRLQDRAIRRRFLLANSQPSANAAHHIYMVAPVDLAGSEIQWLKPLRQANRLTVLLHGGVRSDGYHPDGVIRRCYELLDVAPPRPSNASSAYSRFVESVYADDTNIGARAREFADQQRESPAANRLHVYSANDFEQEARAVDLAVRRSYANGAREIAIVTPDRKLARRVRALLERANLSLRDTAGWALSTTSAATALMRWIECVEQDFAHAPLLDFLKSPFVTLGLPKPELESVVHHFEAEIVQAYNVAGGLDRYRRAIRRHAQRELASGSRVQSEDPRESDVSPLESLIDRLEAAAEPLLKRINTRAPRSAANHLDSLYSSLDKAGLVTGLSADAAGNQLLAVLRPEHAGSGTRGARLMWSEFHHWLQRELERRRFRPPLPPDGVDLLDLAESRCRQFDALIIAGCTRDHLPGPLANSPFFNDGVRANLGLPTREQRLLAPLHDFRRLLESAPKILVTWRQSEDGNDVLPSPWLERLVAFHRLAYDSDLEDSELRSLLAAKETALYRRDESMLPQPATVPAPPLPRTRFPATLSAKSHQRLLDCPYQFFIADGLGLRALDEVHDEMEKSDFGENVHRILHAFHTGVPGLPGPWQGAIEPGNRQQAVDLLRDLGRHVFGYDNDPRLSTRGWHFRWDNFVETYVAWQEQRARTWQVEATEQKLERPFPVGDHALTLTGRADRIDRGPDGLAIIDYKTGNTPNQDAVLSGEQAQLPFYALLHPDDIAEVRYAKFEREAVKANVGAEAEELANLSHRLEQRLHALLVDIDDGAPLTAWGDPQTCEYCRYQGLCRKEMWSTAASPPSNTVAEPTRTATNEQLDFFPGARD